MYGLVAVVWYCFFKACLLSNRLHKIHCPQKYWNTTTLNTQHCSKKIINRNSKIQSNKSAKDSKL